MTENRKRLGHQGETLAIEFLKQKGLKILSRNLRTKIGEIDILAEDKQTLVIVEVKTKTSTTFGSAIEMITRSKAEKLGLIALELSAKQQKTAVRVDLVTIDRYSTEPKLGYHRGVIEYRG